MERCLHVHTLSEHCLIWLLKEWWHTINAFIICSPCLDCSQALRNCVTFWVARVLCWVQGGSAAEQWGCELPKCCNIALGEHCGLPYPTAATHWWSAMPLMCAPTRLPTLCSSEELGPILDMKPADWGTRKHLSSHTEATHGAIFNESMTNSPAAEEKIIQHKEWCAWRSNLF